ncbi:MAG: hypothetical protein DMG48_16150 [Acidobacteria bacterium]|nr:MAG: hypothetical protein DMG48_16150 [Acidobacteriota bacterium]
MSVTFPLFAFEKDDKSMRLIESESRILSRLEGIDIENGEYVFWDANGEGVSVAVSVGTFKSKLESVASCPLAFPIQDAFKAYAMSLGLSEVFAETTPMSIWLRIQAEVGQRPKKRSYLSRLFSS